MNKPFLIAILLLTACGPSKYDAFAQCTADNGAIFYGTFWCPHCKVQKDMFGSAIDNVNYVECSTPDGKAQTQVCIDAKIKNYPTWVFADGSRLVGEQTFDTLSKKTGCALP